MNAWHINHILILSKKRCEWDRIQSKRLTTKQFQQHRTVPLNMYLISFNGRRVHHVEVTQEVANSFVDLARMNSHAPRSRDEEEELLIYNYSKDIVYSGKHLRPGEEVNFDQIYVFPDAAP